MSELTALFRRRTTARSLLTRAYNKTKEIIDDKPALSAVNVRLEYLEKNFANFEDIQDGIEQLVEEDDLDGENSVREDVEEQYLEHKALLLSIYEEVTPVNPVNPPDRPIQSHHNMDTGRAKLPRMELPTFSGDVKEWTSFYDLFKVMVHDKPGLTEVEKLQYLKGCVHGEPAKVIQSLQITSGNYNEAWALLKERYEDKRQIISAHMKAIVTHTAVASESSQKLRTLIDSVEENRRALSVLKKIHGTTYWFIYCRKSWTRRAAKHGNSRLTRLTHMHRQPTRISEHSSSSDVRH